MRYNDLSDFKFYRGKQDHRRYLAVHVTDEDAEKIGERSRLWMMLGKAMCLGFMKLARPDCWVVAKLDQRNNRIMQLDYCPEGIFERDYKLMDKQDFKVAE